MKVMDGKVRNNMNTAIPRNVATNTTTRTEVYQAVNSERDFQESFVLPERQYYQTHTLGEFILMLNQYAAQCQQKWTHHADKVDGYPESLHEVRKLAAIAIRCMEQHGAPFREIPKKLKVVEEDDSVDLESILEQLKNDSETDEGTFDVQPKIKSLPRKRKR
jgi:hypothetical protein